MKCISLISGGIDSPVATYLIAKKNVETVPVFFDNYPFSGREKKDLVYEIVEVLKEKDSNIKDLIVFPHGENLNAFVSSCKRRFACVLCKRMMFRIASTYGKKIGADFLVTGDSLAQVASQTLQNIYVTERASLLPIVRPLIGLDKIEIEEMAKRIGTFELSTRPTICCTAVPDKPATSANLDEIEEEEKEVDVERLVGYSLKHIKK
ncbi:MAG: hypothetical protein J7K68_05625 [Candidatus Diapherotrites archaeon]|nr:hypothetical protein [Candidatus Diapherotrites archaeon]